MEQKVTSLSKIIEAIGIAPVAISDETAKMLQIERAICYLWEQFTEFYFAGMQPQNNEKDEVVSAINDISNLMWKMINEKMMSNNIMTKEIIL